MTADQSPSHTSGRRHPAAPDPREFANLIELLEDAAVRYAGMPAFGLRTDTGTEHRWTAAELLHRARLAAWRLRALGLEPGDRLATWSPSTPELPALYFGAMLAGVIVVPLDLRMAPDVVRRIVERSGARWIAVGTGHDAPDLTIAGLEQTRQRTVASFVTPLEDEGSDRHVTGDSRADGSGAARSVADGSSVIGPPPPPDWEAQLDRWARPGRDDVFEVIYTSGTTGHPKGVMLTHGTILSTIDAIARIIPPRYHRVVSLLPLSHLFEQAPVLFYGAMVGADILYLRSRNPRVIFDALREHRVTTMVVVPQLLELFWLGLIREVDRRGKRATFERARRIARHLPYPLRRLLFRQIHRQLGGELSLLVSAGAFLPPDLQRGWEDLGVVVVQGYGATECGPAAATSERDHPTGSVGRTVEPVQLELADDGEILISGPTVFPGYWQDDAATAAVLDADGWYHTGDIGHLDAQGRLALSGRKRNVIVLPNGLNVFPEDLENALQVAGLEQAVVVETDPGRIEAIVLPPGSPPVVSATSPAPTRPETEQEVRALKTRIDELVRAANRTLAAHQRIAAWRLWPEPDFPRTHTLKIQRDAVRAWAAGTVPLQIREEAPAGEGEPGGARD